jgi:hypothetical protein
MQGAPKLYAQQQEQQHQVVTGIPVRMHSNGACAVLLNGSFPVHATGNGVYTVLPGGTAAAVGLVPPSHHSYARAQGGGAAGSQLAALLPQLLQSPPVQMLKPAAPLLPIAEGQHVLAKVQPVRYASLVLVPVCPEETAGRNGLSLCAFDATCHQHGRYSTRARETTS